MSASTVSITANPSTAARRRPVVVGEKKSNIEVMVHESQPNGGGDDKVIAGGGRDLSHHSIRGEAVLERSSKDLVQVKKNMGVNSTVSPRRSRKVVGKPEKPRWVTVVSIFTKNLVLLVVILGLVQLIRRLAMKSGEDLVGTPMAISEVEGRFAEVESFVKTTAKMMQVQLEVVDRKIESEIGGLKREVSKQIDDRDVTLEVQLKKLDERTEGLEKSLHDLKAVDWLSKEEFDRFYDQLKKEKSGDSDDSNVNLDAVRAYAREMIVKEIEKHAADGLGRVDYALASGGAMIVRHSEPYLAGKRSNWFSTSKQGVHNDAVRMLKPSFGEPGHCFPLKGSSGFVQIRLRTAIIPEAITLEHVAKSVAYDRSSAPKNCRVSGWLQGHDLVDSAVDAEKMFLLTEFTYDLEKSNAQTFNVLDVAGLGIVDTVRFDFTSNHGSQSHTCIYRLRVHGHEPDSVLMMAKQA